MIKVLIIDVDGTLTDGKIYMSSSGELMKAFNTKDGYAIANLLRQNSIEPIILTGRYSEIVKLRAQELNINQVYQGCNDKELAMGEICKNNSVLKEELAYIGDDDNDIESMRMCHLTGCPADASINVRNFVNYVAKSRGGEGAVREFIEYIIASNEREVLNA